MRTYTKLEIALVAAVAGLLLVLGGFHYNDVMHPCEAYGSESILLYMQHTKHGMERVEGKPCLVRK